MDSAQQKRKRGRRRPDNQALSIQHSALGQLWLSIHANLLPKGDQISVRRKHQQLTLAVVLVHRSINITFRQSVELRLEFGVQPIHVANVDVVSETSITGRSTVAASLFQNAKPRGLAMHIGIIGGPK